MALPFGNDTSPFYLFSAQAPCWNPRQKKIILIKELHCDGLYASSVTSSDTAFSTGTVVAASPLTGRSVPLDAGMGS